MNADLLNNSLALRAFACGWRSRDHDLHWFTAVCAISLRSAANTQPKCWLEWLKLESTVCTAVPTEATT